MQKVEETEGVLLTAGKHERRCHCEPLHNANPRFAEAALHLWADKTPEEAHKVLAADDIVVTNQSDKPTQLSKLQRLEDEVRQWRARGASPSQAAASEQSTLHAEDGQHVC